MRARFLLSFLASVLVLHIGVHSFHAAPHCPGALVRGNQREFSLNREASGPLSGGVRALAEQVGLWREISYPPSFSDVFKKKPELWTLG